MADGFKSQRVDDFGKGMDVEDLARLVLRALGRRVFWRLRSRSGNALRGMTSSALPMVLCESRCRGLRAGDAAAFMRCGLPALCAVDQWPRRQWMTFRLAEAQPRRGQPDLDRNQDLHRAGRGRRPMRVRRSDPQVRHLTGCGLAHFRAQPVAVSGA